MTGIDVVFATWAGQPAVTERSGATSSEERLVESARRGDPDAFTALVRAHQRRVFRLAGRFFRQSADVEDVAQETFLTAWQKLDRYRADGPLEAWLTRICLNCCYGRLRRRKRRGEEPLPESEPAAESPEPGARVEVARLLGRLPAKDRFLLLLLDGEEWTVQEAAAALGWSQSNVKVRAHRARKRLRRLLEAEP